MMPPSPRHVRPANLGCPDSHCPWVYNCVGVNNHRHFFLYLVCLTAGILAYDWLLYFCKYFACAKKKEEKRKPSSTPTDC